MNPILSQSVQSFLKQSASGQPTPGGGSAAALTAALGAAMGAMTGNLSLGEKFKPAAHEMQLLVSGMNQIMLEAEALLEEDIRVFNRYMASLRLPKATEEEREARSRQLQEAVLAAAEVPLALLRLCVHALRQLAQEGTAARINAHVLSDLGIAAVLLEAAAQSAVLTCEMNLAALQDSAMKSRLGTQVQQLAAEADQRKLTLLQAVRARMDAL